MSFVVVLTIRDQSVKNKNFSKISIKARIIRKVMMNRTKVITLAMTMKMTMETIIILTVDLLYLISSVVVVRRIINQKLTFNSLTQVIPDAQLRNIINLRKHKIFLRMLNNLFIKLLQSDSSLRVEFQLRLFRNK